MTTELEHRQDEALDTYKAAQLQADIAAADCAELLADIISRPAPMLNHNSLKLAQEATTAWRHATAEALTARDTWYALLDAK